jgi:hypothetical protein
MANRIRVKKRTEYRNAVTEAIAARDDYIKLLVEEINFFASLAHTHGLRSTRVRAGIDARKRIKKADRKLALGKVRME